MVFMVFVVPRNTGIFMVSVVLVVSSVKKTNDPLPKQPPSSTPKRQNNVAVQTRHLHKHAQSQGFSRSGVEAS